MVVQVLKGLAYLHQCDLFHSDIKPSNILIDWEGRVSYILCRDLKVRLCDLDGIYLSEISCTGEYFPEGTEEIDRRCTDIWALGITVIEFVEKIPPRLRTTYYDTHARLIYKESLYHPHVLAFVNSCLKKNPSSRPSANSLLKHKLVSGIKDETLALKNLFPHRVSYANYVTSSAHFNEFKSNCAKENQWDTFSIFPLKFWHIFVHLLE